MTPAPRRPRAWIRYVVVAVGILALIAVLGGIKAAQIGKLMGMGKAFQAAGPPPESVTTAIADEQTWEATLSAVASLVSAKGVAVSADALGLVTKIHFESGASVRQGQVLVELDTSVERAQLASVRARRDLAQAQMKRSSSLVSSGVISQSQAESDEASFKSLTAEANALSAQIAKKTIRAPFTGKLGIREVNLGQYLAPGTTVASLETSDSIFADFTLPQRELNRLAVGMRVRAVQEANGAELAEGAISAIDPTIDPVTRNVKLRASLPDVKGMRPGMFVRIDVLLPEEHRVVAVPGTAVVHASYGDSVFFTEMKPVGEAKTMKKVAHQAFVKLGETRGDYVAVLEGIKPGQEIVTAGAFKLKNGVPLAVNDKVKLDPQVEPKPENR
ncbi:MAG TPA: efflux RND transporter periplasmic adaptor subunit [Polyangiaceae bacterium]